MADPPAGGSLQGTDVGCQVGSSSRSCEQTPSSGGEALPSGGAAVSQVSSGTGAFLRLEPVAPLNVVQDLLRWIM